MRAWRILLPLGSSHKLLGGPGLGARAAIFWAPIWGRLKLFGPAFMEGLQFWVPLGDKRVSVTKKKTAWEGRSAIWLLFPASSSNDVLTRIYSLLGFIDKLQPLYVQLFFFFFASVQAVVTTTTCFSSKFVMILKYTPFSRTYCIKFILHRRRVFSPDIIILTILQGE